MVGLIISLIALFLINCLLIFYIKKTQDELGKLSEIQQSKKRLEKDNKDLTDKNKKLIENNNRKTEELNTLNHEIQVADLKRQQAIQLADKDIELEIAKRRAAFEKKLEEELEEYKQAHSLTSYQQLVENLEAKIEEHKQSLRVIQEQVKKQEEKEDFVKVHSLSITAVDKADIALIRDFSIKLFRKDVFQKLIWTEYYQRPLQALRKALNVDKISGIYKITEIKTGKSYIGQAINIGERWAEHVKTGLGIGSNVYQTNKFYKTLNEKGPESFSFELVEKCEPTKLNERERYWIEYFNSISFGFNTKVGG